MFLASWSSLGRGITPALIQSKTPSITLSTDSENVNGTMTYGLKEKPTQCPNWSLTFHLLDITWRTPAPLGENLTYYCRHWRWEKAANAEDIGKFQCRNLLKLNWKLSYRNVIIIFYSCIFSTDLSLYLLFSSAVKDFLADEFGLNRVWTME